MFQQEVLVGARHIVGADVRDGRRAVQFVGKPLCCREVYSPATVDVICEGETVETLYELAGGGHAVHVDGWTRLYDRETSIAALFFPEPADLEPGGRFAALGAMNQMEV